MNTPSVVFLTGASRGIGLAIATKLLADGARVATLSRSVPQELEALVAQYPDALFAAKGDVSDIDAVKTTLAETVSKFGHLDSVILSAGIGVMGSVANCTLSDWPKQFNVNVFSLIGTLQVAIPHLRASPNTGRIVLMSSGLGAMALPGLSAYCAAKAAVNSIARSLKLEEPDLISLSIHPGIVDTAMIRELIETGADNGVHPATLKFFTDSLAAQKGLAKHPYPAVPAEVPARVFAWLAMNAPQELSGKVSSFYDEEIQKLMAQGANPSTEATA